MRHWGPRLLELVELEREIQLTVVWVSLAVCYSQHCVIQTYSLLKRLVTSICRVFNAGPLGMLAFPPGFLTNITSESSSPRPCWLTSKSINNGSTSSKPQFHYIFFLLCSLLFCTENIFRFDFIKQEKSMI